MKLILRYSIIILGFTITTVILAMSIHILYY